MAEQNESIHSGPGAAAIARSRHEQPGNSWKRQSQQRFSGRTSKQFGGRPDGGQQYGGQGSFQGPGAQVGGYGGGYYPSTGYQSRAWNANWHDERHPKLKTMMATYLERTNGRVHLSKLLQDPIGICTPKLTALPMLVQRPGAVHLSRMPLPPTGWTPPCKGHNERLCGQSCRHAQQRGNRPMRTIPNRRVASEETKSHIRGTAHPLPTTPRDISGGRETGKTNIN